MFRFQTIFKKRLALLPGNSGVFMFRTSYLAKSAVVCLVFVTTALTEYAICNKDSGRLLHKHRIEVGAPVNEAVELGSLHCPDRPDAHAIATRIIETQRFLVAEARENYETADKNDLFAGENLAPSALFPYRLVALYQFNAVYRI